jgi:hypothetical protein
MTEAYRAGLMRETGVAMRQRDKLTKEQRAWLARFKRRMRNVNAISTGHYPADPCATCGGTGRDNATTSDDPEDCGDCRGTGKTCACRECPAPGDCSEDSGDEGSFSWSDCDGCGSSLGGNRYAAHGLVAPKRYHKRTMLIHLDVCVDCLCFIANGDLPDSPETER